MHVGPQLSRVLSRDLFRRWALGYLGGRARGFRRGSVSMAAVVGAIKVAQSHGVQDDEISSVLGEFDLSWDPVNGVTDMLTK